jgi:Rrf2 family iron-sulfur cluster assembly transcriptional regulator
MQISTKGKYSVRAILDIAQNSNGAPIPLASISKREGISLLFLEQMFQQLRKGDIVKSVRGPHGGFVLARDASEITVGDVLRQIEPPLYTSSCFSKGESVENCRIADSCVSFVLWKQLAEHVENFLDSVTIADLCNQTKTEVVYGLKMKSTRHLPKKSRESEAVTADAAEVA